MAKTIVVSVERRFAHPRFRKVVTGYKKFYAHDEKGEAKVGRPGAHPGNAADVQDQALASGAGGSTRRSAGAN